MPKLYSSEHPLRILLSKGFVFVSQRGSHIKLRKIDQNPVLTVILPASRKEIPIGTFKSIVRQSGLSEEEFKTL